MRKYCIARAKKMLRFVYLYIVNCFHFTYASVLSSSPSLNPHSNESFMEEFRSGMKSNECIENKPLALRNLYGWISFCLNDGASISFWFPESRRHTFTMQMDHRIVRHRVEEKTTEQLHSAIHDILHTQCNNTVYISTSHHAPHH